MAACRLQGPSARAHLGLSERRGLGLARLPHQRKSRLAPVHGFLFQKQGERLPRPGRARQSRYSHLLELQHFLPMKPAIGAPDQGAVIVLLVSETRTRVLEPGGFSAGEVGVPNQGLAVPTGRGEHELTGLAGGKQPLTITGGDRLLRRKRVVERLELIQPALRVGDELHAKAVLRVSAPDLVAAILAE